MHKLVRNFFKCYILPGKSLGNVDKQVSGQTGCSKIKQQNLQVTYSETVPALAAADHLVWKDYSHERT